MKFNFTIDEALAALRAGDAVVYPTETFYGLGADALSAQAVERLLAIKAREANKPIALIAADAPMAFALAREVPANARRLAAAFWPGPLTLVLPARDGLPPALLGPDDGVGVRVSPHPTARSLSTRLGKPLTATSANLSRQPPALTLDEAYAAFGNKVKVYLEGGRLAGGAPSTVVAFEGEQVRVLREGAVPSRQITAFLAVGILE